MATPSRPLGDLSAVKLALMAKQARAQLGPIARAEPIAIIGLGCRFPGGVDSPEAFWSLLRDGVDAVGPIPRDRWDVDSLYDPDPAAPGKTSANQGGFLERIDAFDADYFGILRREAERMDPQQRVFLEVAIEALDRAGLPRERLAGTATGVFVASYYNDYTFLQMEDRDWIDSRTLTGTQHSVLANRLSHFLDLRGPSISIDTACSSSLVAVHLACQSLRTGDSNMALAGGVSLIVGAETMMTLSKVGFMSPTGRCRTFDARADGFVRGEGCGVVVLKRLSDAIADEDRVLAVIRGSAVNQDGRSTVLAAPSGPAQEALVRDALANAQLSPDRVGFIEAHGTATPLGDPIEVEALARTIGAPRGDGSTCYLGSVKANLGHLEAASGVAGLIKTTLVLQHGEIPRQLHFGALNPHLSLTGTCLAVADRHRSWPAGARPRVAGISGFGVGGTNAHVLVEEAPALPEAPGLAAADEQQLLTLSAQSDAALRDLVGRWAAWLPASRLPFAEIANASRTRRSHHDHRLALVARSQEEAVTALHAHLSGAAASGVAASAGATRGTPRVTFVFSGQGSQWARMGVELAAREPVFRGVLEDLDRAIQGAAGWSLMSLLEAERDVSRLDDTEFAQPAIFAIQVALAALWASWGVRPDAVIGHSVGEIAALHVGGVLSLDDAVRIVLLRARIMHAATGDGRMEAAALTAADAELLVQDIGPDLSVGAVNAPRSVVLSGTPAAVQQAIAILDARGVWHRPLPVSYAFHSAQMAPFEAELAAAIGPLAVQSAQVAAYSTVTGRGLDGREIDAAYFGRNVRQTVRFADAVMAALEAGTDAFLEMAPHAVLGAAVGETAASLPDRRGDVPVLASMHKDRDSRGVLLQACAGLYALGQPILFESMSGRRRRPVDLPPYPWQRQRFWLRGDRPAVTAPRHAVTLLGTRRDDATGDVLFEGRWPASELVWLHEHEIGGRTIVPAAALLATLQDAAQQATGVATAALVDFVVHRPMVLGAFGSWTTSVSSTHAGARVELRVADSPDREPALTATATVTTLADDHAAASLTLGATGETVWHDDVAALYQRFETFGVRFGPAFRSVERWRVARGHAEGWLSVDAGVAPDAQRAALIDGALQLSVLAATEGLPQAHVLPVAVEYVSMPATLPRRIRVVARVESLGASGSIAASARIFSEAGQPLATLGHIRFARADASAVHGADLYEIGWLPASRVPSSSGAIEAAGAWIVLAGGDARGTALVDRLRAAGARCLTVAIGETTGRRDATSWTIAPADGQGLDGCLADAAWRDGLPLRGIVHLWSLDDGGPAGVAMAADWRTSGSAMALLQALLRTSHVGTPVWLVTRGAQAATGSTFDSHGAGLWGVANLATAEYGDLRCHAVDLDPTDPDITPLLAEVTAQPEEPLRVALRGAERFVPSIQRADDSVPTQSVPASSRLELIEAGTFDGLAWVSRAPAVPGPREVRLRVLAAGLNFRDVLMALRMYPSPAATLGAECCGVVEAVGDDVENVRVGDCVFGFAPDSLATTVVVPASFVTRVPRGLAVDAAAAQPVAFLTAMFGLEQIARVQPGMRVLVHAGAGGVGLAAIQVAQHCGAEVFATAGSAAKRERLLALGVVDVFDSRSPSFADDLMRVTGGSGVDVVLNSLSGDFIPAGLRTVRPAGWFLELGKRGIWTTEQVAAAYPHVRYRAYDLGESAAADHAWLAELLRNLSDRLASGALRPLPVRTFPFGAAADAFRVMAQAGHVGKLALRAPRAIERGGDAPLVHAHATYLITGGTGGLGLRTARWLVERGARHLVLTGRRALAPSAQSSVDDLVARGASVELRFVDAADEGAMSALGDEIDRSMPPLRGVVHAAGILDEGLLTQQTWLRWRAVLSGKAVGARVLDAVTRRHTLDFFVLYSSVSTWLGPVGQGAYVAANAELDAIAWARRSQGLPALSVGWGQYRDAGMAVRMIEAGQDPWSLRGLGWLASDAAFARLERLLRTGATHAFVSPIDWRQFLSRLPGGVSRSFFARVAPPDRPAAPARATTALAGGTNGHATIDAWRTAPARERLDLVRAFVAERARQIIGLSDDTAIDPRVALKDVGLDSLMAVELRNVLTRALSTPLPATLLFDYPTLDAIVKLLDQTWQLSTPPVASPAAVDDAVTEIAALSEAEAEALLLAELDQAAEKAR